MNATPKPDPRSRRGARIDEINLVSRMTMLKADKIPPQMPPNPAPHIIAKLLDIGLTSAAGMGVGPISWSEIVAFRDATYTPIAPWEAKMIRRLSLAYVTELRRAESESCPAPWRGEVTQAERDAEDRGLRALFG